MTLTTRRWLKYGGLAAAISLVTAVCLLFAAAWANNEVAWPIAIEGVVRQISLSCLMYREEYGALPQASSSRQLAVLLERTGYGGTYKVHREEGDPIWDIWGSEIAYETTPDGFSLTSPGPDQLLGTEDDIRADLRGETIAFKRRWSQQVGAANSGSAGAPPE